MDQPPPAVELGVVDVVQALARLDTDLDHDARRERTVLEVRGQRRTLEVVEHDVRRAVGRDVVVHHPDDVRVREARRDLGLALEPRQDLIAGQLGVEQLDRDLLAGQALVAREEHRAHAAAADQSLDRVGLGDHLPDIDARPRR